MSGIHEEKLGEAGKRVLDVAKKQKSVIFDKERIGGGMWKLTYTLQNSQGVAAFSGKHITSYADAITGKERILFDINGEYMTGFMMDTTLKTIDPATNPWNVTLLDWLIGHPEVGVEGIKIDQLDYVRVKNSNPRFKLVNLNEQEVEAIDDNDEIDRMIGRLVAVGPKAISLAKVRHVLAALNKPYMEHKHISKPSTEKKVLMNIIKNHVRTGKDEARQIGIILDNLEDAQWSYELRELMRYGMIAKTNGSFKYNDIPLGIEPQSVINWFKQNHDTWDALQAQLHERLRTDGFLK